MANDGHDKKADGLTGPLGLQVGVFALVLCAALYLASCSPDSTVTLFGAAAAPGDSGSLAPDDALPGEVIPRGIVDSAIAESTGTLADVGEAGPANPEATPPAGDMDTAPPDDLLDTLNIPDTFETLTVPDQLDSGPDQQILGQAEVDEIEADQEEAEILVAAEVAQDIAQDSCIAGDSVSTCDDGEPCTLDTCASTGACTHSPISCDDADFCTVDACSPAGVCQHAAKECDDQQPCTVDTCDLAGSCTATAKDCADADPCSVDNCAPTGACVHMPKDCSDASACTQDSCDLSGLCQHAAIPCQDGKPCTADTCDAKLGTCSFAPVVGCAAKCLPGQPWWNGTTFSCKQFSVDPGWKMAPGFKAVVVSNAMKGLKIPNAITFGGCAFGNLLYVVDRGGQAVHSVNVATGETKLFADGNKWSPKSVVLTSIAWDTAGQLDGGLYVGDQVTDNDGDAVVFRLQANGSVAAFAFGPGPGLNDIFTLLFVDQPGYPSGLYAAGDTDGPSVDWGILDAQGNSKTFSKLRDAEGACFDTTGKYGGGLLVARPATGGYQGNDAIDLVGADGGKVKSVASGLPGIHAPAIAPSGPFGGKLYAASWQDGTLLAFDPSGAKKVVASQLALSNYDGNILAFSPDGAILLVAESMAGRVVCVDLAGP